MHENLFLPAVSDLDTRSNSLTHTLRLPVYLWMQCPLNEVSTHTGRCLRLCFSVLHVKGCSSSSITALVTCVNVCAHNLAGFAGKYVCVCVYVYPYSGRPGCRYHPSPCHKAPGLLGRQQTAARRWGWSWILIRPLFSPASHDGKSLTSGLENKAESFSQRAANTH